MKCENRFFEWQVLLAVVVAFSFHLLAEESIAPIEVARFSAYSEGPVFDSQGNLFVSHGKSSVAKITPQGQVGLWVEAENPNGHKVLPDGTHLLCVKGAVLHLSAEGHRLRPASTECNGRPLRAPNDLTLSPSGGFYFTDPGGSRLAPNWYGSLRR